MLYLILEPQAAYIRNVTEAIKRNCNIETTSEWWSEVVLEDGRVALKVQDGSGLSPEELASCVEFLPFLYFESESDRDAFNLAESVYNGGRTTEGWYEVGDDSEGYYVDLATNTEDNSFWNRVKNRFR